MADPAPAPSTIDRSAPYERLALDARSWVDLARGFLRDPDELFDALAAGEWVQGSRFVYDHRVDDAFVTRRVARDGSDLHPVLRRAQRTLEDRYRVRFAAPGIVMYRDGRDGIGFHRDREMRYLDDTLIACVTLGGPRPLLLKPRRGGPVHDLAPGPGDLYVMGGRCQADWLHAVPRQRGGPARVAVLWRWSSRTGRPERGPGYRAPRRYGDRAPRSGVTSARHEGQK